MPPAPRVRSPYAQDRPVGVVFWAKASPEVAARLAKGDKRMRPGDWRSGDEVRVVDVALLGRSEEKVKILLSQSAWGLTCYIQFRGN